MPLQHKLLLLDDDEDVLDLYKEMFSHLPSKPEIHTATSGARALALLEAEEYSLLISDLNMPRMDGLQVIAIVRRKFPQLRTIVLTAVQDEQFRARAYSMGIDLFLEKPSNQQEIKFLLDCIESLLGKEKLEGFRGVQNKSLVDLIQLEALSQSSSTLKIVNGKFEGKIWIAQGQVIDAMTEESSGEEGFKRILSWKTGNFEILPAEKGHPKKILGPIHGLLLDSAQSMDEAAAASPVPVEGKGEPTHASKNKLAQLAQLPGLEFGITMSLDPRETAEHWGLENPEQMANWARDSIARFEALARIAQWGELEELETSGLQRHTNARIKGGKIFMVGMRGSLEREEVRANLKRIGKQWAF